jgi:3-oxoacyl-[acyl-carrier-protein] synthase-3
MPELSISGISIKGISVAVPSNREDNSTLDSISERSRNEILNQVGIRYRHVAEETTTAADLCFFSAEKLLEDLNWASTEIGLMVFVSQTPDYLVPGSATQLQDRLGLPTNCICLDINQGCAGYVYGLSVMSGMMRSFGIERGLLLVGDTITKIISKEDNSLRPIFADAGSATALEFDVDSDEKMVFRLGSNGSSYQAIYTEDGGFRNSLNKDSLKMKMVSEGVSRQANQLSMNGQAVFTFGLSTVASEIKELLKSQQFTELEIDYIVLHQANQLLNDSIVRKVGFDKSKAPSSLYNFGNTSCATIPITLVTQLREELITGCKTMLLSGFGVGLSWGNVILTTENIVCPKLIYC